MDTVLANDDNLQGGVTYTFTFILANLFTQPSISTILQDIASQAPSFVGSVTASWSAGVGLFTNYLNVTFNYTGDGSDVVGDVANEFIAAFQAGSGDSFTFDQSTSGTAGVTTLSSVKNTASEVGEAVGTTAGSLVGGAASGIASNLGAAGWGTIGLVVIALLAYLAFTTGFLRPSNA